MTPDPGSYYTESREEIQPENGKAFLPHCHTSNKGVWEKAGDEKLMEKYFGECIMTGAYKILYVAPERLESQGFVEFTEQILISMVTVDEAHCISQW